MINRTCVRQDCGNAFTVKIASDPKKYCSRSCAVTVNNSVAPKRSLTVQRTCACGKLFYKNEVRRQYCSSDCKAKYTKAPKIEDWLSGVWSGGNDRKLNNRVREWLIEKANFTCMYDGCGFNTPHPSDGRSVLEVDHIDGDGTNHSPSNLTVLCPNHHALTPTYRGRNAGNGRPVYYQRVVRS